MLRLSQELEARRDRRLAKLFPDAGPFRRELYPRHLAFFRAGAEHEERCFLAGNRVGKTVAGGYEVTLHLTGLYPDWWEGRRFSRPTAGWAAGDTQKTTKDIIQATLFGGDQDPDGLVPPDCIIGRPTSKQGVPGGYETVRIRHVSGGISTLDFKSYDQGRRTFQGTKRDFIWFDEEPPLDVYNEALMRTATTDPSEPPGLMLCTFTPLEGMSETVLYFLPNGEIP